MAALRIKSQWYQSGTPRTPQQTASAMAFIVWRLTQNMLKQMRDAGFDIDVGPQYFAFMREVLVFLCQVVDRMAYERMEVVDRAAFTSALVHRVAEVLEESEDNLLGTPDASGRLSAWSANPRSTNAPRTRMSWMRWYEPMARPNCMRSLA